jgi:hypothetical protein
MSQTSYSINIPAFAFPGQLANLVRSKIQTALAVAAPLPYGLLIVRDTANSSGVDQAGKLPSASGDVANGKILGVSVADQARAQDPSVASAQYPLNSAVSCLRDGEIVVAPEADVTIAAGDPVYARITANGAGKLQLGAFRNDGDSGNAILVPNAVWKSAGTAGAFCVLSIMDV